MASREKLVRSFAKRTADMSKPQIGTALTLNSKDTAPIIAGRPFSKAALANLKRGGDVTRTGTRGRINEDDPGWNPKTMGNRRGSTRINEDDPNWNPQTMGNKRGATAPYYRKSKNGSRPD